MNELGVFLLSTAAIQLLSRRIKACSVHSSLSFAEPFLFHCPFHPQQFVAASIHSHLHTHSTLHIPTPHSYWPTAPSTTSLPLHSYRNIFGFICLGSLPPLFFPRLLAFLFFLFLLLSTFTSHIHTHTFTHAHPHSSLSSLFPTILTLSHLLFTTPFVKHSSSSCLSKPRPTPTSQPSCLSFYFLLILTPTRRHLFPSLATTNTHTMATAEYEQFWTTEDALLRGTATFHFDPELTQEESRGLSAEPEPTLASGQAYPVLPVEDENTFENTGSLDEYDEQDDHYGKH